MKQSESKKPKDPIIILHGWGLRGNLYQELRFLLGQNGYKVFSPDLPGFGTEPLRKQKNLDDYLYFLDDFLKKNKLSKVIIIAHSFGGRIAVKYAAIHPEKISKLILTGVPIIREITSFKKAIYILTRPVKFVSSLFPKKINDLMRKSVYVLIGERDYYKSGNLKEVFVNIINEDLIEYVKKLNVPIYLVWGEKDSITKASDINKIKRYAPSAKSKIVSGMGHSFIYKNSTEFFKAIEHFL